MQPQHMALKWLCGPLQASSGLLEMGYLGSSSPKLQETSSLAALWDTQRIPQEMRQRNLREGAAPAWHPHFALLSHRSAGGERGLTLGTCLTVEKGNGGGEIPGDSRLRESRVFQQEMQRYREVCYYMLFALAAYGWPIYLMRKPTCGLCRLARSCS